MQIFLNGQQLVDADVQDRDLLRFTVGAATYKCEVRARGDFFSLTQIVPDDADAVLTATVDETPTEQATGLVAHNILRSAARQLSLTFDGATSSGDLSALLVAAGVDIPVLLSTGEIHQVAP